MSRRFLTPVNLLHVATDPTVATEGDIYYNTTSDKIRVYIGDSWSDVGGSSIEVSDTAPESPQIGSAWYKNDTGEFYVYDGSFWVEVNGVVASNTFSTISVSGQSDVVADSVTDTLTLIAGTNVSITTDATADSITINADSKATSSVYLVRNNTGSTILKGTLVSASGAEPSGRIDVEPFAAVGGINSELTVMGMATANISSGVNGEVMSFGTLTGIDTRGNTASAIAVGDETWAEGDILFAHPTVAGKLTKVRPQHDLAVAFITVRHASTGQIAVRIVPGNNHLEWMHDVLIDTPEDNEVLAYNSGSGVWINQTAGEAGLATSNHNHTVNSLSNVVITGTPADGQALVWDTTTSKWVNETVTQDLSGYATETYVGTAISNLVDTAPTTLDTLNELAAALGDDPNFATTISTALGEKAPIASPTFTGTVTLSGDLAVNGGDITSSASVVNLFNGLQTISIGNGGAFAPGQQPVNIASDRDFPRVNIGNNSVTIGGQINIGGGSFTNPVDVVISGDVSFPRGFTVTGQASIDDLYLTNPLSYEYGGTGLTTLGTAGQVLKVNSGETGLEWGTVDLSLYAPIASPSFTGTVTIPAGASISGYLTTASASSTYQPLDADLTAIAEGVWSSGLLKKIAPNTWGTITDNSTNWNTAYTDRNKWDGGSTGLNAATGRASLGLGTMATQSAANYALLAGPTFTGTTTLGAVRIESTSTSPAVIVTGNQYQSMFWWKNNTGSVVASVGGNGTIYATGFSGDGSQLTNVQAPLLSDFNSNVKGGTYTLNNNTTGSGNSVFGTQSMLSNSTGSSNSAFGSISMLNNTTGGSNSAFGNASLVWNSVGSFNVAVGNSALYLNGYNSTNESQGYNNTGIGSYALANNTIGFNNTALGYNSGGEISTGSNNLILGSNDGSSIATLSNNIIISDGSGNIRAQYLSANSGWTISGNTSMPGNLVVGGDLTVNGTTTTINTTELLIEDNLITLNSNVTGTPSVNAGIEVERGDLANVQIRFNETTDKWEYTNDGTIYTEIGTGTGGGSTMISTNVALSNSFWLGA